MTPNLLQTAKILRLVLLERKRLREDIRQMRHRRMSQRPEPVKEEMETKRA
ncbi:MAG: hypothetical protein AAFX07_11570 [Pseudomonadota bacterium]